MDIRTGEIVPEQKVETMRQNQDPNAKWYKKIPEELVQEMWGMNRKQRREFYKNNKKRFKEV